MTHSQNELPSSERVRKLFEALPEHERADGHTDGLARLLGERAASYTDSQLQQLRQEMRELAGLLLDFYCAKELARTKRASNKKDEARLDRCQEDPTIGTSQLTT